MSAGGLLAQMFLGGSAEAAGGIGERLRLEAVEARKSKMLGEEVKAREGIVDKEHNYRVSEQKDAQDWELKNRVPGETWMDVKDGSGNLVGQRSNTGKLVQFEHKEPKNELPAATKARLDGIDNDYRATADNLSRAIEAQDQELVKNLSSQLDSLRIERGRLLGDEGPTRPKPLTSDAITNIISGVPSGTENTMDFLSQAERSGRFAPEDLDTLRRKLSIRDKQLKHSERGGQGDYASSGGLLDVPVQQPPKAENAADPSSPIPSAVDISRSQDASLAERNKADAAAIAKRKAFEASPEGQFAKATNDAKSAARKHTINGKLNPRGFEQELMQIQDDYQLSDEQIEQIRKSATSIK